MWNAGIYCLWCCQKKFSRTYQHPSHISKYFNGIREFVNNLNFCVKFWDKFILYPIETPMQSICKFYFKYTLSPSLCAIVSLGNFKSVKYSFMNLKILL